MFYSLTWVTKYAFRGVGSRSPHGDIQKKNIGRSLNASRGVNYKWNRQIFTMSNVSMMVDSGSTAKRGPILDLLTGKDDDGGFVCRGWKSEDGESSCGYSSFRGKRVTMEDFFDVKNNKFLCQPQYHICFCLHGKCRNKPSES